MDKKINVVTLGCSKNTVDSEVLMAQLHKNGWQVLSNSESIEAKVVIINTCGFIGDAKEESINTILSFVAAKQQGSIRRIYAIGCLAHRYRDELRAEIPELDGVFRLSELPQLMGELRATYHPDCATERLLTTPKHYAYLKISEGCSWRCAYCAIPLIRGNHVSRSIESLVEETQMLVAQGVREIIVIAQDSTYYGIDLYGERRLPELLQRIADVDGVRWVRLHYAHPAHFPAEVLDLMATNPKICPYIDIPLQHVTTPMLTAMRRHHTGPEVDALIGYMRERVPNLAIRTTFLVGFPGETAADFEAMLQFVRKHKLDRVGVFAYSEEEGTAAAAMADNVPAEVKQQRVDALMELQREISLENNQRLVGQRCTVIVDSVEPDMLIARTMHDSPEVDQEVQVLLSESATVRPGDFIEVEIVEAMDYDLVARLV